jgi:hypothetical protein
MRNLLLTTALSVCLSAPALAQSKPACVDVAGDASYAWADVAAQAEGSGVAIEELTPDQREVATARYNEAPPPSHDKFDHIYLGIHKDSGEVQEVFVTDGCIKDTGDFADMQHFLHAMLPAPHASQKDDKGTF